MKNNKEQILFLPRPCRPILLAIMLVMGLSACNGKSPRQPPPSGPPRPQTLAEPHTPGVHNALFSYSGKVSLSSQNQQKGDKKRHVIRT